MEEGSSQAHELPAPLTEELLHEVLSRVSLERRAKIRLKFLKELSLQLRPPLPVAPVLRATHSQRAP
jgi:hypothetical protein